MFSRDELRKIPSYQPRQVLAKLEEACQPAAPPGPWGLELPLLTLWLEGGFQLKVEFISYREGIGVWARSLESAGDEVGLVAVPLERIVAISLNCQTSQLRRQLRRRTPSTCLLTALGIRREVEFWLEPWRTQLGLTLALDVAWGDFLALGPAHEVLPALQEGLANLRDQLEGIAISKMGVVGLQGLGSILISPPPGAEGSPAGPPTFTLTRLGAQVNYCPLMEDGLPLWPSPVELRRALEKVL